MTAIARPFVKSAGGKSKLVPTILEILPNKFTRYFEPFVGGGAVFWGIQAARPGMLESAWLNDANRALAGTYEVVMGNVDKLIERLQHERYTNDLDHFLEVRASNFDLDDRISANRIRNAADFIYVNKTAFNGLFRVNSSGQFNVPFGRYENPTICDADNLRACSAALKKALIGSLDFAEMATPHAERGAVCYLDPPYLPLTTGSDFTKYTANGFNHEDHVRLHDLALKLKKRGVFVLLSNSDSPLTRSLYSTKNWTLKEVSMARSINSSGGKRGKVGELLIY